MVNWFDLRVINSGNLYLLALPVPRWWRWQVHYWEISSKSHAKPSLLRLCSQQNLHLWTQSRFDRFIFWFTSCIKWFILTTDDQPNSFILSRRLYSILEPILQNFLYAIMHNFSISDIKLGHLIAGIIIFTYYKHSSLTLS